MIPQSEAQAFVLDSLTRLPAVTRTLQEAIGCVSTETLTAREDVPRFANSAMDGYAVCSLDTENAPTQLVVKGQILAGDQPTLNLSPGTAIRIMTGAVLPVGADSVCPIEDVTVTDDGHSVNISAKVARGAYVRQAGDDTAVGQVLLEAGDTVQAAHIGVLSGQDLASISVYPRPRVGILSTGNEISHEATLVVGKIRDTNQPTLIAQLRRSNFEAINLGYCADDEVEIVAALKRGARECDAVISTGGVSVGDVDLVKSALTQLCNGRARWMQVAIKPGKPFAFGTVGDARTPIFGLPGNPVSALVSFEIFVRPALNFLAGRSELMRPTLNAVLDCAIPKEPDAKTHYVHVYARFHHDGRLHVERTMHRGSHVLSAIGNANAIAIVTGDHALDAGDEAPTMILDVERLGPRDP